MGSHCTKFSLGCVVATANAQATLDLEDIENALGRHSTGDWGEVCPEDGEENELSLREGFRLFSVYRSKDGVKFWVITEADRTSTTVLLPEDY